MRAQHVPVEPLDRARVVAEQQIGARSRTQPAMPCGTAVVAALAPADEAVVGLDATKVHGRQPASQCSASTRAIFMAASRRPQAERAAGLGGEALERRRVHLRAAASR